MSILDRLLMRPTQAEIETLARQLFNTSRSLSDQLAVDAGTFITRSELRKALREGSVPFNANLDHLDSLLARADALLDYDPDAGFFEHGIRISLREAAEALRGAVESAREAART